MAAGLGFKTFTTGEVLTAADTNGYLMQGVLVFASAAARDAAITSPQEGQFAYLKDTNVTTYYTGSAWANLDTTGMTNPMTTTGDTIYSSSGSTPARLGIGSTGQVLTVAGGIPSWATPASGAKIVQVVTAETTTETGNSTNVYSDTTLTASITPTSASNKILVIASHNGVGRTATSSASNVLIKLLRGATEIAGSFYIGETNTALRVYIGSTVITKMDTPATTSATTYKTQFMNGGNAAAAYVQLGSSTSTMVLMEVAP